MLAGLLAVTILVIPGRAALAQQDSRVCRVRKEPSGLIRGDRLPRGCVLVSEDDAVRSAQTPDARVVPLGPCAQYAERLIYTPKPGSSVLANAARICRPALSRAEAGAAAAAQQRRSSYGPTQRHFGPLQRHFGPLERHFGPLQRHFGPLERKF
ncbi:MAG: hypothetical protein AMS25_05125 [Gemmatimonas sp. SM23_52]|nr:MAG: hypothetical protein AMS25_05125 [Gemmatimonas sp. SM23_52]